MFNVILTFCLKLKKIIRSPEAIFKIQTQKDLLKLFFHVQSIEDFQACDFSLSENTCIKHIIFHFHFIWLMIWHLELSCLLILKIPVLETHWNKNKKQANSKNLCPLLMEKEEHVQIIGCLGGGGALRRVGRAIGSYGIKLQSFLRNCWKWKLHIRQYEFDRSLPEAIGSCCVKYYCKNWKASQDVKWKQEVSQTDKTMDRWMDRQTDRNPNFYWGTKDLISYDIHIFQ